MKQQKIQNLFTNMQTDSKEVISPESISSDENIATYYATKGNESKLTRNQLIEPELNIGVYYNAFLSDSSSHEWNQISGAVYRNDGTLVTESKIRSEQKSVPSIALSRFQNAPHFTGRYLYLGHYNEVYGHFILESLSRLWALEHFLAEKDIKFIFQRVRQYDLNSRQYTAEFFEALGVDINRITIVDKDTTVQTLYLPSMAYDLGKSMHRYQKTMYQFLSEKLTNKATETPKSANIYLSRKKLDIGTHKYLNEKDIEHLFRVYGFSILYPEKMDITNQLQHYNNVECLAAPHSSAIHNSLFCPKESKIISLNSRGKNHALLQHQLCHEMQQNFYCIEGVRAMEIAGVPSGRPSYLMPLAHLNKSLASILGYTQELDVRHTNLNTTINLIENLAYWLARQDMFEHARAYIRLLQFVPWKLQSVLNLHKLLRGRQSIATERDTDYKLFPDNQIHAIAFTPKTNPANFATLLKSVKALSSK